MSVLLTYIAQNLIDGALKKLGITEPSPEEREDSLVVLNQLIGTIATDPDLWIQGIVPVTGFINLSDPIAAPVEYANYLICSLAILLAPEYGKKPSDSVIAMASNSAALIKRQNYALLGRRIPANTITR